MPTCAPSPLGEHGDKDFALRLVSIGRESYLRAYSRFPAAHTPPAGYFYAFASGGPYGAAPPVGRGRDGGLRRMALAAENIMRYGMVFAGRPELTDSGTQEKEKAPPKAPGEAFHKKSLPVLLFFQGTVL